MIYSTKNCLDSPTVLYPTYPSDLDQTETSATSTAPPAITPREIPTTIVTDLSTKESFETPPVSPTNDTVISSTPAEATVTCTTDEQKTMTPSSVEPTLHDDPKLHEVKDEKIQEAPNLSSEVSVPPPVEEAKVVPEKAGEVTEAKSTASWEAAPRPSEEVRDPIPAEKSSAPHIFSERDTGPFSPLAPDQTPNLEGEPVHFFDRTIVIPDYEPGKEQETGKQEKAQEMTTKVAGEEEPEIKIVDPETIPQNVLTMADQVAEKIMDDAKSEWKSVEEETTAPPARPGDSVIPLEDSDITEPADVSPPPGLSQQPRLSLDLSLTETNKTIAAATATTASDEFTTQLDESRDLGESTQPSMISTTVATPPPPPPQVSNGSPPDIKVETPHADQTELNRIAEFLETLNTEPKEIEKLAATIPEESGVGIVSDEPIVTMIEESKTSEDSMLKEGSQGVSQVGKSKIEFTPVDEVAERGGLIDLPDICYVTQPIEETQKGRDRASFLRSSVEITSIDVSEPPTAALDKEWKPSEPESKVKLEQVSAASPPESLEETMKKLKHVPDEAVGGSPSQKEKLKKRKSSAASEISEDSQKESEIDKYVDRMSSMQSSRRAMIEKEMFKTSSRSSQAGSESGEQQADQSSNFHRPGLLDSGQINREPLSPEGFDLEEHIFDKMKEVERWATATMVAAAELQPDSVEIEDDPGGGNLEDGRFMDELPVMGSDKAEMVVSGEIDSNEIISERDETGTEAILELLPTSQIPPGIIQQVSRLIDQAVQEGISEAVKLLVGNEKLTEKLDQVLEELSASQGKKALRPISKMELATESKSEGSLLEPTTEEVMVTAVEFHTNPNLGSGGPCNLNSSELITDLDKELTRTYDSNNKQAEIFPLEHVEPSTSTTSQTCSNTDVHRSIPDNILTSPKIEACSDDTVESSLTTVAFTGKDNVGIAQITEECESTSSATAEASPTQDKTITTPEPTPSTIATPPLVSDASSQGDKKEEQPQETKVVAVTQEESPESTIQELETIKEEIECLSSELDKMESAVATAPTGAALVEAVENKAEGSTDTIKSVDGPEIKPEISGVDGEKAPVLEAVAEGTKVSDKVVDQIPTEVTVVQEISAAPQNICQASEGSPAAVKVTHDTEVVSQEPQSQPEARSEIESPAEKVIEKALAISDQPIAEVSPATTDQTITEEAVPVVAPVQATKDEVKVDPLTELPKTEVTLKEPLKVDVVKDAPAEANAEPTKVTQPVQEPVIVKADETVQPEIAPKVEADETVAKSESKMEEQIVPPIETVASTVIPKIEASTPTDTAKLETPEEPKSIETVEPKIPEKATPIQETLSQKSEEPVETVEPSQPDKAIPVETIIPPKPDNETIAKSEEAIKVDTTSFLPEETPSPIDVVKTEDKGSPASPPPTEPKEPLPSPVEPTSAVAEVKKPEEPAPQKVVVAPASEPIVPQLATPKAEPPILGECEKSDAKSVIESAPTTEMPTADIKEPATDEIATAAGTPPSPTKETKSDKTSLVSNVEVAPPDTSVAQEKAHEEGKVSEDVSSKEIIPTETQQMPSQPVTESESAALQLPPPISPATTPAEENLAAPAKNQESAVITQPTSEIPSVPDSSIVAQEPGAGEALSFTELRFETLDEPPPFSIPSTAPHTIPETTTVINDPSITTTMNTVTSSCFVDSSSSSKLVDEPTGASPSSHPLTVEILDAKSPETFPLPSSASEPLAPSTSPVEKLQSEAGENDVETVGVSLSPIDAASPSTITTTTTITDSAAEKQATQASSANVIDTSNTTTTGVAASTCPPPPDRSGESSPPSATNIITDQVISSEKMVTDEGTAVISPTPPPSPAVSSINEPPAFPSKSGVQMSSVAPSSAESQAQPSPKDDANRESGQNYFCTFSIYLLSVN